MEFPHHKHVLNVERNVMRRVFVAMTSRRIWQVKYLPHSLNYELLLFLGFFSFSQGDKKLFFKHWKKHEVRERENEIKTKRMKFLESRGCLAHDLNELHHKHAKREREKERENSVSWQASKACSTSIIWVWFTRARKKTFRTKRRERERKWKRRRQKSNWASKCREGKCAFSIEEKGREREREKQKSAPECRITLVPLTLARATTLSSFR